MPQQWTNTLPPSHTVCLETKPWSHKPGAMTKEGQKSHAAAEEPCSRRRQLQATVQRQERQNMMTISLPTTIHTAVHDHATASEMALV